MKRILLPWGLLLAMLLAWSGCSTTQAPPPAPTSLRHPPEAYRINGNWWSDGSYRVNRRDPESIEHYWRDQDNDLELLPVSALHGMLPETINSLDAKCRAQSTPAAYWLGWKMRRGNPWPLGIVCFRGRTMTRAEVVEACARLTSRGKVMETAWRHPDEWTFACREPESRPFGRAVTRDGH